MHHTKLLGTLLPELSFIIKNIYAPHGLIPHNIALAEESREYSACSFEIENKKIIFRMAKITPTKAGQFVTLWKRIGDGPIMPFEITDPFDFCIISVRKENTVGQFIFPKKVLYEKSFVSENGNSGKRAMRVYPPWDLPDNRQAKKTQAWQLNYFVDMNVDEFDGKRLKEILGL